MSQFVTGAIMQVSARASPKQTSGPVTSHDPALALRAVGDD